MQFQVATIAFYTPAVEVALAHYRDKQREHLEWYDKLSESDKFDCRDHTPWVREIDFIEQRRVRFQQSDWLMGIILDEDEYCLLNRIDSYGKDLGAE